jgi:RNA polymerase sigma-70 factor (ECF subfamily)
MRVSACYRLTVHDLTDADLASRVTAGDAGAEAELCRRFAPRVRLYGLRHLRDEDAAGDLAQQALMVVLEALRAGRLESPDRLPAFLFGACRNLVLSMRRGERRTLVEYEGEPIVAPAEPGVDRHRLASCFDGLPRREQQLLSMSFHEERPIDEIAAALELTAVNARVIRHRAIARLRTCMEGA